MPIEPLTPVFCFLYSVSFLLLFSLPCFSQDTLANTKPLTIQGDVSAQMVAGIDRFLLRQIDQSIEQRQALWHQDFSSATAYERSIGPNRERFRSLIGAVDPRLPCTALEFVSSTSSQALICETTLFSAYAVRWQVFEGVFGEGLWLRPKGVTIARVIAIPDADQTPEMVTGLAPVLAPERQFARRLAENGCEVLVPVLLDRHDTWSGNAKLKRFTNQPHREWIYRQAFEMGRHIIGYEVQKVLAAIDFFESEEQPADAQKETGTNTRSTADHSPKIGVMGYSEGGLIAFYAAGLDARIKAALVSGYFDSRQRLWEEPIYRNVFGLLREFGDAEIANLIAPRALIVEHSKVATVDGPPAPRQGRAGAAPGKLGTPDYESVEGEYERARALLKGAKGFAPFQLICGNEGMATGPASDRALAAFLTALKGAPQDLKAPGPPPEDMQFGAHDSERAALTNAVAVRQQEQVGQLEEFTQHLLRQSDQVRADYVWNRIKAVSPEEWHSACAGFRSNLWDEIIGRVSAPASAPDPRTRKLYERPKWVGYEVVLDVFPDVFAWGYLLLPKDLKPGERRPVVVCQHGLEGVPADVVDEIPESKAFGYYKAFAARLAERGFVVFAPHNPYRGEDRFRRLQRLANPLGLSLFSIIIAQHNQILDWMAQQSFVDPDRIAFYGLSYGGKTAMRVPAALDRYALSICSGDFNDWISKNVSTTFAGSYMFLGEYEMPEFNLGSTFNYAEMAALIAPRPFMVERGHNDGVGVDEWVASEYAKVRRLYDRLGIGNRTAIEFFNGPHTINGNATFEFLHQQLHWPKD